MTDMKSVVILAALTGALLEAQATPPPAAVPATLAVPAGFTVIWLSVLRRCESAQCRAVRAGRQD